ncbi:MAG: DEAD/DEAH box helicase family protein, partial [Nitrospirae bacterium]|nr:DEAD/DEAH box helicase family protein [Nitrospirota bacterium]
MRTTFGKTWWGTRWVEAMERIDLDTNRLPRGRRYAKGGMVREIRIQDGTVFAKVQGSRPRPYAIEITLARFTPRQIATLRGIIEAHPEIVPEFLIGRLPEGVLALLAKKKMPLLPSRWEEIEARCSCPDWANPCKHLAAVYYLMANEIDKDPLMVLALRGVTKENLGSLLNQAPRSREPRQGNGFLPYSKVTFPSPSPGTLPDPLPDLSFERLAIETLFSLLPDRPLFYPAGDFKRLLRQAYKRVADQIETMEVHEDTPSFRETDFYLLAHPDDETLFVCPPDPLPPSLKEGRSGKVYAKPLPLVSETSLVLSSRKGRAIKPGPVFDLLFSLPLELNAGDASPSARFLNIASSLALAFIRAASYIPDVVSHGDGDFSLRYIPLIHEEKQRQAIAVLCALLPPNLIFREKDRAVLTGEPGVQSVLSLMITYVVHRCAGTEIRDKLCDAAFRGIPYLAERFEERQTAKALTDWLERLSVRARAFSPVIRIESGQGGFRLQLDIENKKDPMSPLFPLARLFNPKGRVPDASIASVHTEVLRQIAIASEYLPALKTVVSRKGKKAVELDSRALAGFLTQAKSVLDLLGIRVIIPKELAGLVTPRLSIKAALKGGGETVSYLSLDRMLDFSWQVAIGDATISGKEFAALVKRAEGVVRFKDHYLLLTPEEAQGILTRLHKPVPALTSMEALQAALHGEVNGMVFDPDEAFRRALADLTKVEEIAIPSTLQATLRPYQERGFRWLYTNIKRGFGVCLADDMGLGKTVQVITLLMKLKDEGSLREPALVICPTTLVGNWQKECERFAPSLKTTVYHGTERKPAPSGHDLVITTYGIVRREVNRFSDRQWPVLILDEAQQIKNPAADQSRAVKDLKTGAAIALSGTPVENRLTELWSIFDFLNRGYLGPVDRFKRQYAVPIEKYRDRAQIERLRKVTAPFLLRRVKTDRTIIADLPDKLVVDAYCYLTKE